MPSLNVTANSELSSSEKDLVGKQENAETSLPLESLENLDNSNTNAISTKSRLRLIPLEESLMDDSAVAHKEEQLDHIIYRRNIMPLSSETTMTDDSFEISQRQWEKMKENKESQNRNRQSQGSLGSIQSDSADAYLYFNKSSHGKWKRRKGAAPAPPPVKKILQMLPLQEIRHELEVIEVQQQGLEKQGVQLEKMIRERCEGPEAENGNEA